MPAITDHVLREVNAERQAQHLKWGDEHDDTHTWNEWIDLIIKHARLAGHGEPERQQFVRVAALAVAAVEALDRTRSTQ